MGPEQLSALEAGLRDHVEKQKHAKQIQSPTDSTLSPSPLPSSSSLSDRASEYLGETITAEHMDLILLLCCFISGLSDSGSFNTWSCFVNMQTGNTIFLALGASHQPANKPYGWLRSIVAIAFFTLGCFFFGLSERIGSRTRGVLFASFVTQDICLAIAAALVQAKLIPDDVDSMRVLIPIALVGFQAGGQVVASNLLGFKELPTTVLTSVYSGLATDRRVMAGFKANPKRNRRVAAVVLLALGAISGGWLMKDKRAGMAVILWIATGLKFFIAGCWLFWRKESL